MSVEHSDDGTKTEAHRVSDPREESIDEVSDQTDNRPPIVMDADQGDSDVVAVHEEVSVGGWIEIESEAVVDLRWMDHHTPEKPAPDERDMENIVNYVHSGWYVINDNDDNSGESYLQTTKTVEVRR